MATRILTAALAVSAINWLGCSSSDSGNSGSGGGTGITTQTGGTDSNGGQSAAGQVNTGGSTSSSTRRFPGDLCTADSECSGLTSLKGVCMAGWPGGGYCTTEPCVNTLNCAGYGWCADDGTGTNTTRCLRSCFDDSDCRTGYVCPTDGCVPAS